MNIEAGLDYEHDKGQPTTKIGGYLRFTEWMVTLEFVTIPKLIILPSVLLYSVGGPKFIFFFWPLWSFFSFTSFAIYFASYPEFPEVINTELVNPTVSKYLQVIRISSINSIRILIVWSCIDMILSLVSLVATALIMFGVFTEADGTVNDSWLSTYILGVIECLFCLVSIASRASIIVGYTCCGPSRSIGYVGELVYRRICLGLSILGAILSVIFLSMCLHNFLKITYYYTSDGSDEGCDPMVKKACLLPYPSSHFLVLDSSTVTGYRVHIRDKSLPFLKRGVRMSADYSANNYDGFSVSSMLLWHLQGDVQDTQLVSYTDVEKSLSWNSTTLLINAASVSLQPHFTEKDYVDPHSDKLTYIMPARSLDYDTDYVALVQGLTDVDGALLPPAELTRLYIDTFITGGLSAASLADSDDRFARFSTSAFPMLTSQGVNLSVVQLLWDFHTASLNSTLWPLSDIGDQTKAQLRARIAQNRTSSLYRLEFEKNDQCSGGGVSGNRGGKMASTRFYRLSVPWYLVNNQRVKNYLDRNLIGDTHVEFQERAGLIVQIPCSVKTGQVPVTSLMEVGHGLFWDRGFARSRWVRRLANEMGWILWSMDWRGLTRHDLPQFARLLMYDMGKSSLFLQSFLVQGFSDKLVGAAVVGDIAARYCTKSNCIMSSLPGTSTPIFRSNALSLPSSYIGLSLGAVLGGGWNAFYPDHQRAVLVAGGSSISFLLGRSDLFGLYIYLCDLQFYSRVDIRIALQLLQSALDSVESGGWAQSGRYAHRQILVQNAIGDATISHIAGRILAANVNASLLQPAVNPDLHLPSVESPVFDSPSLYFEQLFKKDFKDIPSKSKPPTEQNDVHTCFILQDEVQALSMEFVGNGSVTNPCGESPCVYKKEIECTYA